MSEGSKRRPLLRMLYRDKETKQNYEVGAVWPPSTRFKGLVGSLSPQYVEDEGKMPLAEALRLVEEKRGYLNVTLTREGTVEARAWALQAEPPMRATAERPSPPPDDFDWGADDKVPF